MQYPWRRYNNFPTIPDFIDTEGRHYVQPTNDVLEQFQEPGEITYELKLPKGKGLEFPEREVTLLPWNNQQSPIRYRVRACFFLPRGATGVINIYKESSSE